MVEVYQSIINWANNIQLNGVIAFNTIAIFNNQVKRESKGKGYVFWKPALFIEIKSSKDETYGANDQLTGSELEVIFHIVHNELDDATGNLDQNINVFTLRNLVKKSYSLFQPLQCGVFNYYGEEQQFTHDNIYIYKIKYKCWYVDTSAYPIPDQMYYYATGSVVGTYSVGFTYSVQN